MQQSVQDRKRAAIFGYRLMFSPETQPIKRTIVRELVFSQLIESDRPNGESIGKLTTVSANGVDILRLPSDEVLKQLEDLVQKKLIERITVKNKKRWKVTEAGKVKFSGVRIGVDSRIDNVVNTIFAGCEPIAEYREALLECLSTIFGRIADRYIDEIISDDRTGTNFLPANIEEVATNVHLSHPKVSHEEFFPGLREFFLSEHPDAVWIKWTFCKNYYALKIVGLGDVSNALSKEAFTGLSVYLDTNVILSALDKRDENYSVVMHLLERIRGLGCEIGVLDVTAKELSELAIWQGETVQDVLNQIPDELLPRTKGLAASVELLYRQDDSNPSTEAVLAEFENADRIIGERLGLPIVYTSSFDADPPSDVVQSLASTLKSNYDTGRRQGDDRRKSESAALHDALALIFVKRMRADGKRCVFLTLDKSLPTFRFPEDTTQLRPAITIDALLSWLGIILEDDESIERAYSTLLSAQLVTSQQDFSIGEFAMLSQVGMDCKNMPSDDMEQCILYLRREAQGLDLRSADDREKLHHKVTSFFSSPARKYLGEMAVLRDGVDKSAVVAEELRRQVKSSENRGIELSEKAKYVSKVARTKDRLWIVRIVLLVGILSVIWAASEYATGENILQKVISFWPLFGLVLALCFALARVWCRGDLWPIAKKQLFWPFSGSETR